MTASARTAAAGAAPALRLLAERVGACGVALAWCEIDAPGPHADTAAGRRAAHDARGALGLVDAHPIGRHDDGRPCWPPQITGSIAHAGSVALAGAAALAASASERERPAERAVGVDIEVAGALPAADAVLVLDADERTRVAHHRAPDAMATLLWSAKEAAYKAWHTGTDGGLVDVDPVHIHVELAPAGDSPVGAPHPVAATATGPLREMTAPVGVLRGWYVETSGYVAVVLVGVERASRAAARGPHHGRDGMASDATTNPSAENASR